MHDITCPIVYHRSVSDILCSILWLIAMLALPAIACADRTHDVTRRSTPSSSRALHSVEPAQQRLNQTPPTACRATMTPPPPSRRRGPPHRTTPLLLAALLAATASAPLAAAVTTGECNTLADAFVPLLAEQSSSLATTSGCSSATSFQVCDAEGVQGPCSTVSECDAELTTVSDSCTSSNRYSSCCIIAIQSLCTGTSCSAQSGGLCSQICDTEIDGPTPSPDDSGDDGSNVGVAVGASLAAIVVVGALVAVGVWWFCCRKKDGAEAGEPGKVMVRSDHACMPAVYIHGACRCL